MKQYTAKDIRNIALVGHAGSGKTSLAEAAFYLTGQADRLGRVADGTTVCDFDPEEIRRGASVSTALLPVEWKDTKMNFLDTPGLFDFSAGIANIFFVNKLDSAHADFYKVFEELKIKFGPMVCPIVVPYVVDHQVQCYVNLLEYKAYTYADGKATEVPIPDMGHRLDGLRTAINEAVAETSEELMEKYFSGEAFTPDELIMGLATGIRRGEIAPVFCGSAQQLEGVDQLLNGLRWLAPWAETVAGENGVDPDGNEVALTVNKVICGKVSPDTQLLNMRTGQQEKIGKVFYVRGKKQEEAPYIGAGDIGAVAKLNNTNTGDTLCAPARPVVLPGIDFEKPSLSMAVVAKNKGDEEKIASGLQLSHRSRNARADFVRFG